MQKPSHVTHLCKKRMSRTHAVSGSRQVPVQKTHVTYSCNTRVTSRTCAGFLVLLPLFALPGVRVEIGETFTLASSLLCALSVHHALTCGTKVITLTPPWDKGHNTYTSLRDTGHNTYTSLWDTGHNTLPCGTQVMTFTPACGTEVITLTPFCETEFITVTHPVGHRSQRLILHLGQRSRDLYLWDRGNNISTFLWNVLAGTPLCETEFITVIHPVDLRS